MSIIEIVIDDEKDDVYTIGTLDEVAADFDAAKIDGGSLVVLRENRSVGINSKIVLAKPKKTEPKTQKKTAKKTTKKGTKK